MTNDQISKNMIKVYYAKQNTNNASSALHDFQSLVSQVIVLTNAAMNNQIIICILVANIWVSKPKQHEGCNIPLKSTIPTCNRPVNRRDTKI